MKKINLNFNEANEFVLSLGKAYKPDLFGFTNTSVSLDADYETQLAGASYILTSEFMEVGEKTEDKNGFSLRYNVTPKNVGVKINVKYIDGTNAVMQNTEVVNNDEENHILACATSANVNGVCYDDGLPISDRLKDGSILIHYACNKWQGEGQWRTATPEQLGVYDTTSHGWEKAVFRLDSVSTWNGSAFYPVTIIEDKKKNQSWFFDVYAPHSWFFEVYSVSGKYSKFLSVKMGGADERLGFAKDMKKGDAFKTCNCVYGLVDGGFEEVIKELTKIRRILSIEKCGIPITFNDYMNCNWAMENNERLLPLIDSAAKLGVKVFCIDDGWQVEQGVWDNADEKFEGLGVKGVIDYIKDKGMIPGVWFEFELVPYKLKDEIGDGDNAFLFRNGKILAPHRTFGNFRSEKFRKYLMKKIDDAYEMGVRYIKNDHNNMEYMGATNYGESAGEGLTENARAFITFIDEIRAKYPDLILENCASGANRIDGETLRHFAVQSLTDQEDYLKNPSIIGGQFGVLLPEKAGVWCYPYPLIFDRLNDFTLTEEEKKSFSDGEQTIFNVVNGLSAAMYVSGRIEQMDELNFNLLKEGIELSEKLIPFVRSSYPVYPMGTISMFDKTEYALGLADDKYNTVYLSVWNLSDEKRTVKVDMTKYALNNCEMAYPKKSEGVSFKFKKGVLTVKFSKGYSARYFKLTK